MFNFYTVSALSGSVVITVESPRQLSHFVMSYHAAPRQFHHREDFSVIVCIPVVHARNRKYSTNWINPSVLRRCWLGDRKGNMACKMSFSADSADGSFHGVLYTSTWRDSSLSSRTLVGRPTAVRTLQCCVATAPQVAYI